MFEYTGQGRGYREGPEKGRNRKTRQDTTIVIVIQRLWRFGPEW